MTDDHIGRLYDQIVALKKQLSACQAELAAARQATEAIVARLPKTVDGVPVTPGMNIYYTGVKSYSHCVVDAVNSDGTVDMHGVEWNGTRHNTWKQDHVQGYSTRESAEAAWRKA